MRHQSSRFSSEFNGFCQPNLFFSSFSKEWDIALISILEKKRELSRSTKKTKKTNKIQEQICLLSSLLSSGATRIRLTYFNSSPASYIAILFLPFLHTLSALLPSLRSAAELWVSEEKMWRYGQRAFNCDWTCQAWSCLILPLILRWNSVQCWMRKLKGCPFAYGRDDHLKRVGSPLLFELSMTARTLASFMGESWLVRARLRKALLHPLLGHGSALELSVIVTSVSNCQFCH